MKVAIVSLCACLLFEVTAAYPSDASSSSPGSTPICGSHETYTECGSACEPNCSRYLNGVMVSCIAMCVPGCFCNPGLLRADDGSCVEPEECAFPKCPKNEVYRTCGTACEDTCDNLNHTCRACIAVCREGCFCKEGFVRSGENGTCVRKEQCPEPTCAGPNEYYDSCAAQTECPPQTCMSLVAKYKCPEEDTSPNRCCSPKCRCIEGHLREKGKCVKINDCPQMAGRVVKRSADVKCGENEVFSDCVRSCPPPTCDNKFLNIACLLPDCHFGPNPGCDCQGGFLRNGTLSDPCIPESECKP